MKGILLSGGKGTRLAPVSNYLNKQLVPINKRPIIDYSINTLMNLGCQDITIILGGDHYSQIVNYLTHKNIDVNFTFVSQRSPAGIAQAINLCESSFKTEEEFSTILGDNVFENPVKWTDNKSAQVVLTSTPEIKRFGVASIREGKIVKIVEKPTFLQPNAENYAITGLYKFTNRFFDYFKQLIPSERGEFEVTDIIRLYKEEDNLGHTFVEGGWIDCGTFESIELAREMVKRNGLEDSLK